MASLCKSETQMLSLMLHSWCLPNVIINYWEFYLWNNPQIFYSSPSPASLPWSSFTQLSLTGTTTRPFLLVYQHPLSCQYLPIIPVSNVIFSKYNLILSTSSVLHPSMASHCFKDENMTSYRKHKSQQNVAPTFLSSFILYCSPSCSLPFQFLLLTLSLTHLSVRKAILFTDLDLYQLLHI